jgi:hypothetical protein
MKMTQEIEVIRINFVSGAQCSLAEIIPAIPIGLQRMLPAAAYGAVVQSVIIYASRSDRVGYVND